MHRTRTSTNKFATGRIRKAKKDKPQTVLRDSRSINVLRSDLRHTNIRSQYNIGNAGTFQLDEEESGSFTRGIPESLENTESEDSNSGLSDSTCAGDAGATYDNDSFNGLTLSQPFPNISIFLIFIWIVKHMIGISYDHLVKL